ncbi:MAG: PEP-CTERM sorting domain-containing protein [Phycisphaerae bacterium]|jgi:hypothetical protein|nr:PEP-CTERM sorting domain-containing protein [Phycisphaerae bacterium]
MGWCIVALAGLAVLAGGGESKLLAAPGIIPNALRHTGYHVSPDADMNLDGNGGLMAMTPYGTTLMTDGPDGRGLDFNSDQDFIDTGAINQHDQYMNLFFGYFSAPEAGDYEFSIHHADDRCGIWLDLDQDGVFEAPGGVRTGENIAWYPVTHAPPPMDNVATVALEESTYMFAATHGEYAGNAFLDVYFMTPSMSSSVIIKPSDAGQDGMWTTVPEPATLSLLAIGGLSLLRKRRRRA